VSVSFFRVFSGLRATEDDLQHTIPGHS
jgi:hypothetical protein